MARRPAVDTLPQDVRRKLDERLVASGFSGYVALADWLTGQGFAISKSSLQRHGQALEGEHAEAMADARALLALTRASSDLGDAGSEIAASAATILQTDIVRTVLEIRRTDDTELRAKLLAQLTQAQAQIGRMSISVENHRAQARKKALEEASAVVATAAKKQGLSDIGTEALRLAIMGKL